MIKLKYQNYSNYKLPITINPLEYGKLIEQFDNKFIIQLNTSNVVVIKQIENENYVKFYRKGDLMFEFRDTVISDKSFIRTISDQRFTFEDNKLISTEILVHNKYIKIFDIQNNSKSILSKTTPFKFKNILKFLENTHVFKNYKAELFILFELFLIFLVYLICFVIFPEDNITATLSIGGIIKLRRFKSKHSWESQTFRINNKVFTKILFEKIFNRFWRDISHLFNKENHMFILFKIKYINNDYATIGNIQRLSHIDKDWYINWIINNMEFKSEYYNETQIESMIISYGFKDGKIDVKNVINSNLNYQYYNNNKLVISFNPLDFGKLISKSELVNETLYFLQNKNNKVIKILNSKNKNSIEIFKDANLIIKFEDLKLSDSKFVRILENKKYYFENNEQILFSKNIEAKFISNLTITNKIVDNFITLDIETFVKDSILIPFCISIYDGKLSSYYYLSDYKSPEDLILDCLRSIMIRKYNGFNIYIHNLGKFDIIFLFKYLVKLGQVSPIIHNGRIISIKFSFGDNYKYRLHFKDSYLLLLTSLRKLTKSFNVETQKSMFPHFFVNENNLNYIGKVPEIKYFDKINKNDYNNYRKNFKINWNLKNEAIKYCNIDCISLYQVVLKFSELIFQHFGISIHKYPTLPSLAFAIFRTNFIPKNVIPQLSGKISNDIRQGYTGGAVDVYIPYLPKKVKGKGYDVNSLYPFSMDQFEMPVGKPTFFKGDIRKIDPDAFGFFYCNIVAPDDIKHPIIQTHVKTSNGVRTMAPIGTWSDMLFSAEIDNAIKYGYNFKILWGYTFDKGYIFKDYVQNIYNIKKSYPKSDPMYYIAKILLNSLYGRFGMDDNFSDINIIHKDYYGDFENKFIDSIVTKIKIDDYFLVEIKQSENINEENDGNHNINVSIAAAITAYSRIHMSQFKNNPKINLYYTDTDSIYTDSELDPSLISNNELGKMKLENTYKKAIFLSPKVYCLLTEDDTLIYKVKGLKHEIELTMKDFEQLLYKDSFIEKYQTKWTRNLSEGYININILNQLYTLKVTENKRQLIYNKNGKLIGTKAYKIDESKDIRTKL